jgi:glycosyltransferase involved in cell wall biosynthesis
MKVLLLAADDGGCGFYRMREPARVAAELGVDVTVSSEIAVDAVTDSRTKVTLVKEVKTDADLIVIQRPLNQAFTSMLAQAQIQGIATAVELDDDFENVHVKNIAHGAMNGDMTSNARNVFAACALADNVIVSTPALERYARHGRSSVLRNRVPARFAEITPAYERNDRYEPKVGWTGSVQTHPDDLQVTKGAVAEVVEEHSLGFYTVGDGALVQRNLRLSAETPYEATGWIDRELYYEKIPEMSIGVVPLELSPFNEAKSTLKGLEMAALGVPFVASPTREYQRLEAYGIGQTARNPSEWRKRLGQLAADPDRRIAAAKRYRDAVLSGHTYEGAAQEWVDAWQKTIDYRKAHNPATAMVK